MPRPLGGGIKRWCCLTSVCLSVCLSHTSGLNWEQRGLGRIKLAQVAHVTRDSDAIFKVKRSRSQEAGAYCGGLSHSMLLFFMPSVSRIARDLEKLEENCPSDHYSGQSSNTNESCIVARRWIALEKNSRSSPEWWLIFFAISEKKSEADSLIGPRVSTAIGWKR